MTEKKDLINVQVRIDRQLKEDALVVLDSLGLGISDAMRLLFKQMVIQQRWPVELAANRTAPVTTKGNLSAAP